jgi:outer membrane biosynthesis protein TonB
MKQPEKPALGTSNARAVALPHTQQHMILHVVIAGAIALVLLGISLATAQESLPLTNQTSADDVKTTGPFALSVPTAHAAARVDIDAIRERSQERVEAIQERMKDNRPAFVATAHADEGDERNSKAEADERDKEEKDKAKKEEPQKDEKRDEPEEKDKPSSQKEAAPAASEDERDDDEEAQSDAKSTSSDSFGLSGNTKVTESGSMSGGNGDWWVSSGAYFFIKDGIGSTIQGKLVSGDDWRERYASSNPTDTDDGYLPQNIFRLVAKAQFEDVTQEAYFKINDINMTDSPNRAGHNGFLFFNRYHDQDNLYYTGIRVDGSAIIKKKKGGSYTTLSSDQVFSGSYDKSSNPNLIPEGKWVGLRSVVQDVSGGVNIKVYMDTGDGWKLVSEATDTSSPITGKSHVGVRTDFMDVEFKNYRASEN